MAGCKRVFSIKVEGGVDPDRSQLIRINSVFKKKMIMESAEKRMRNMKHLFPRAILVVDYLVTGKKVLFSY